MGAGITVYNDSGITQIDDSSQVNLGLVKKGYLALTTVVSSVSSGELRYADIAVPNGVTPFVALRAESHYQLDSYGVVGTYTSGSTVYIRVAAAIVAGSSPYWQLKYWVFDKPTPSASGFGLQVFDSSGNLKYSSGNRVLPITGVGSGTYPAGSGIPYAIVCNGLLSEVYTYDPSFVSDGRDTFFTGGKIVGTTVSAPNDSPGALIQQESFPSGNSPPPSVNFGLGLTYVTGDNSIIVLNMSGLGLVGDADPIA